MTMTNKDLQEAIDKACGHLIECADLDVEKALKEHIAELLGEQASRASAKRPANAPPVSP